MSHLLSYFLPVRFVYSVKCRINGLCNSEVDPSNIQDILQISVFIQRNLLSERDQNVSETETHTSQELIINNNY